MNEESIEAMLSDTNCSGLRATQLGAAVRKGKVSADAAVRVANRGEGEIVAFLRRTAPDVLDEAAHPPIHPSERVIACNTSSLETVLSQMGCTTQRRRQIALLRETNVIATDEEAIVSATLTDRNFRTFVASKPLAVVLAEQLGKGGRGASQPSAADADTGDTDPDEAELRKMAHLSGTTVKALRKALAKKKEDDEDDDEDDEIDEASLKRNGLSEAHALAKKTTRAHAPQPLGTPCGVNGLTTLKANASPTEVRTAQHALNELNAGEMRRLRASIGDYAREPAPSSEPKTHPGLCCPMPPPGVQTFTKSK